VYHFDHFMSRFGNFWPELVNLSEFKITEVAAQPAGARHPFIVRAAVVDSTGKRQTNFDFHLGKKDLGRLKGAMMTAMIMRVEEL
jgi:hypothetical protein